MFRNCFCFWLFGILCGFILQVGQDLAIELDEIMDILVPPHVRGGRMPSGMGLCQCGMNVSKKNHLARTIQQVPKKGERETVSGRRMSPQLKDVLNAEISLDFCKDP